MALDNDDATIVVALTGDDQERFCRRVLARNHIVRDLVKQAATSVFFGLLFVFIAAWLLSGRGWYQHLPEDGVVAILALAWIAFVALYFQFRLRRLLRKFRQHQSGPERVTVSPAGVAVASEKGAADLPWSAFAAIEATPDAIYLFVDAQRGLIIPAHAFADELRFRRYDERLRAFWSAAR